MSILTFVITFLASLFKSQRQLVLENLALRQQVTMLRQSVKRPRANTADKLFWILFSRYVDSWRQVLHNSAVARQAILLHSLLNQLLLTLWYALLYEFAILLRSTR